MRGAYLTQTELVLPVPSAGKLRIPASEVSGLGLGYIRGERGTRTSLWRLVAWRIGSDAMYSCTTVTCARSSAFENLEVTPAGRATVSCTTRYWSCRGQTARCGHVTNKHTHPRRPRRYQPW